MSPSQRERAAQALATAMVIGDRATSEKLGISLRSIQRWRRDVAEDAELALIVASKKSAAEKDWAEDLAPAITASIDFLRRAAIEANVNDPDVIHSIAGGLKILSDVATARRVLDARLARQAGPAGTQSGPVATGPAGNVVPISRAV